MSTIRIFQRIGSKSYDYETALRTAIEQLQAHGQVLMVVGYPDTINTLLMTMALDCDASVAYLAGMTMGKAADLYPVQSKTNAHDAFTIADTAKTMPYI